MSHILNVKLVLSEKKIIIFILYVQFGVLPVFMPVYHVSEVPTEARRGHLNPWNWSER